MSSFWKRGNYTWQQIRDQDYEFCSLLGLAPQNAFAWLLPKEIVVEHSVPQHGGSIGTDTRWLTIASTNVPVWMEEWGGGLDDCLQVADRTSEDQRHMTAVLAASALVSGLSLRSRRKSCRHTTRRVALDLVSPTAIDSSAAHAVEPEAGELVSRAVVTRLPDGSSAFFQVSGPFPPLVCS